MAFEGKSEANHERKRSIPVTTNLASEINNPCLKEQNLSYKCLDDHNYNREDCKIYFQNYNNCRQFWNEIKLERRRKGIRPQLPPPEERAAIKAERIKTGMIKRVLPFSTPVEGKTLSWSDTPLSERSVSIGGNQGVLLSLAVFSQWIVSALSAPTQRSIG